jgi:hypothetical protein
LIPCPATFKRLVLPPYQLFGHRLGKLLEIAVELDPRAVRFN